MDSHAAVARVRQQLTDELVVASLGTPTALLNLAGDRPLNFYMWSAMGLASSVALGLAIAQPDRKVIVLDGDGSALMNLNGIVTVGWQAPSNLVWIILENGLFLETGGQPIAAGKTADLVAIARGCGIARAEAVNSLDSLGASLEAALATDELSLIVAKVGRQTTRNHAVLDPIRVKNRFMDALAS
ncbi:MAG: thiamine pyrophosphate-dependent enzyme [Chloroflexota bacterium]